MSRSRLSAPDAPPPCDTDARHRGLVGVGGFIPSDEVKAYVDKGSMNFIFGGNGFFGYFFAESQDSSPYRDSPFHVSEPGPLLGW